VASAGGKQEESQRRSWTEIVQTLTAYVAVPVALVYPFGFFALFAQVTKYFYLDSYTAWYAASLVNRMVAIGQGVTILALALIGSVLLSALISQILLKHAKRSRLRRISIRRPSLGYRFLDLGSNLVAWFMLRRFAPTCARCEAYDPTGGDPRTVRRLQQDTGRRQGVFVRPPRQTI
jgi:hypothetical protein